MKKQVLIALVIFGLLVSVVATLVISFSNSASAEYNADSVQGKVNFYVKGNPEPKTDQAMVKFNVIKTR